MFLFLFQFIEKRGSKVFRNSQLPTNDPSDVGSCLFNEGEFLGRICVGMHTGR